MSVNYLKCFTESYSACSLFRQEKEWHQGTDLISPAVNQLHLLGTLAFHCTLCLKEKDWRILKNPMIKAASRMQNILHLSPLFIAGGAKFLPKREYPKTQYFLESLSYQLGNIILTLNIVTIIMFGVLGRRKFFLVSISGYLVNRITHSDNIPYTKRRKLKKVMFFFQTMFDLLFPTSQIIRVMTIVEVILNNLGSCSSYLFGQFAEYTAEGNTDLTLEKLKRIPKYHLGVNSEHLKYPSQQGYDSQLLSSDDFLPIIDRLEEALLKIDFEIYKSHLCLMVNHDEHWDLESWTHQSSKNGQEILFMKEGVHIFLNRLKKKLSGSTSPVSLKIRKYAGSDIRLSNPESLKKIQLMLQYWDKKLGKTEEITAYLLMQLGVNGANYCGPRLRELAHSISKSLGTPSSLFCFLKELQVLIIRNYTTEIVKNDPCFKSGLVRELYGCQTSHFFNKFLFCLGAPFGVNIQGLIDDETLSESQATLLRILMVPTIREYNWWFHTQDYTVNRVFKEVQKAIDSGRLDVNDIYQEFCLEDIQNLNLAFEINDQGKFKITDLGILFYLIKNSVLMVKRVPKNASVAEN